MTKFEFDHAVLDGWLKLEGMMTKRHCQRQEPCDDGDPDTLPASSWIEWDLHIVYSPIWNAPILYLMAISNSQILNLSLHLPKPIISLDASQYNLDPSYSQSALLLFASLPN